MNNFFLLFQIRKNQPFISDECTTSNRDIDLSEEKVAWRKKLRQSGYLQNPYYEEKAMTGLDGRDLNIDLLDLLSHGRQNEHKLAANVQNGIQKPTTRLEHASDIGGEADTGTGGKRPKQNST